MQIETIRVNVLGMLNLADICLEKKLHLTTYATGCIFHYDKDFPEGSGKGFKETDIPNFTGSYYSYTKVSALSGHPGQNVGFMHASCKPYLSHICQAFRAGEALQALLCLIG